MLRRIVTLLAAGALTVSLAACDFTANGTLECHTQTDGKYVCTGSSTAIPVTPSVPTPLPTTQPPVGTPDPTTPPPVTTPPPSDPPVAEAAALFSWGAPIPAESDEFNYSGAPGEMWWNADNCWPGHDGNGRRCGKNTVVDGSKLVMTGDANGDTGIIGQKDGRRYGRWEARVRTAGETTGNTYHPLLIVWPDSDRWPQDGEYDFFENDAPGLNSVTSFIHYPHDPGPVQQIQRVKEGVDTTQWHNIAIEWTPDHVKGFIDGVEWFNHSGGSNATRKNIQDMPSGHLTIQLDNFHGTSMKSAKYEVDWVRTYAL